MTRPDLDVLESLLAKATPGPYYWFMRECADKDALIAELTEVVDKTDAIDGYNLHGVAVGEPDPDADYLVVAHTGCGPRSPANAQLIVAAVNALPALIKRVRELERERDQAISIRNVFADGLVRSVVDKTANLQGQPVDKTAELQARAAALAMRERCAQACEEIARSPAQIDDRTDYVADDCAAAIRALEV